MFEVKPGLWICVDFRDELYGEMKEVYEAGNQLESCHLFF